MRVSKITSILSGMFFCLLLAACSSDRVYWGSEFINILNESGNTLSFIEYMTKKNNQTSFRYINGTYEDGVSATVNISQNPVEPTTMTKIFLYHDDPKCRTFISQLVDTGSVLVNERIQDVNYGNVRYATDVVFNQIGDHCQLFAQYSRQEIYDLFSKAGITGTWYAYIDPAGRLIPVSNREKYNQMRRQKEQCSQEAVGRTRLGCDRVGYNVKTNSWEDTNSYPCMGGWQNTYDTVCKTVYYRGGGRWGSE